MPRSKVTFYLNGQRHQVGPDKAWMMLADYLRYDVCLTGTKVVCAEGDCGACSVLRFFPHVEGEAADYFLPFNSCIAPLVSLDGSSLVTVDALKDGERFHEAQRAMIENHGSQCGFCTPGFVMALAGLADKKITNKEKTIEAREAKNAMTGNLCRCTGYEAIVNAAKDMDLSREKTMVSRFYSKEQDRELKETFKTELKLEGDDFSFYAPKTVQDAAAWLKKYPNTRIVGFATDLGVVQNKRKLRYPRMLSLHLIDELHEVSQKGGVVTVGARVTLSDFRTWLKDKVPHFSEYLDIFASPQIKNVATLVGNVANASPIGDTAPALLALSGAVHLHGPSGDRDVALCDFFLDYRKTDLKEGEFIRSLSFQLPCEKSSFRVTKNSVRKDLDISAVNFAVWARFKDQKKKEIEDIKIAAGGVAAVPLRLRATEDLLKGKNWDDQLVEKACEKMQAEFSPLSDVRASASYRRIVIKNYLKRFFSELESGRRS